MPNPDQDDWTLGDLAAKLGHREFTIVGGAGREGCEVLVRAGRRVVFRESHGCVGAAMRSLVRWARGL